MAPPLPRREQIARRAAAHLRDGTFVNVGIGIPGLVPHHVPDERAITFHAEHGVIGFGSDRFGPAEGAELAFFASTYRMRPGGFLCDHTRSFALVRSGRLEATVLGAFEVEASGRFANYRSAGMSSGCPGGSPELAGAARRVILTLEHRDRHGRPRLVAETTLPVALPRRADLIVTELGTFSANGSGFTALELAEGVSTHDVQEATAAEVTFR